MLAAARPDQALALLDALSAATTAAGAALTLLTSAGAALEVAPERARLAARVPSRG